MDGICFSGGNPSFPLIALAFSEQVEVLRINLCADEVVLITLDSRSGRFNIRDTGDLAAAEKGPRFKTLSDKINEDPTVLFNVLIRLRLIVRFFNRSTFVLLTRLSDYHGSSRAEGCLSRLAEFPTAKLPARWYDLHD